MRDFILNMIALKYIVRVIIPVVLVAIYLIYATLILIKERKKK